MPITDSGPTEQATPVTSQHDPISDTTSRAPRREKSKSHGTENGIIEYVYRARQGKGKAQRVCGILGKDKWETIRFVKKGLPDIAEVEEERIEFQVYNGQWDWMTVLEEAWEVIGRDPPPIWNVTIRESLEEREQRIKLHGRSYFRWIMTSISVLSGIIVPFYAFKTGRMTDSFWGYVQVAAIAAMFQAGIHLMVGLILDM